MPLCRRKADPLKRAFDIVCDLSDTHTCACTHESNAIEEFEQSNTLSSTYCMYGFMYVYSLGSSRSPRCVFAIGSSGLETCQL